jgi:hypothetical protein
MPCQSFGFNPSVGPIIQVAVWPPNYRPSPAAATPASPVSTTLYAALIDTGASCTCISSKIVQALGLQPTGKQQVGHAQGSTAVNTYQFQIAFIFPQTQIPSGAVQAQVIGMMLVGTEFVPPSGTAFDVLLGRDVICRGTFSISFDGHGMFCI